MAGPRWGCRWRISRRTGREHPRVGLVGEIVIGGLDKSRRHYPSFECPAFGQACRAQCRLIRGQNPLRTSLLNWPVSRLGARQSNKSSGGRCGQGHRCRQPRSMALFQLRFDCRLKNDLNERSRSPASHGDQRQRRRRNSVRALSASSSAAGRGHINSMQAERIKRRDAPSVP